MKEYLSGNKILTSTCGKKVSQKWQKKNNIIHVQPRVSLEHFMFASKKQRVKEKHEWKFH